MADEPPAKSPPPDDATVVKPQGSDDGTVVKRTDVEDDATVMADKGASTPEAPGDSGPAVVSDAPPPEDLPDADHPSDATIVAPGSDAAPVGPEGAGDHTLARPAVGAEPTAASTAPVRETRGWTGTVPASEPANIPAGGASRPAVQGVVLGVITGLLLFAATAWWLLRGR